MVEERSDPTRVTVVTGGGSGMGRAICRRLAAQGHGVAVLDIDSDATEQVAKEIEADGGRAIGVTVDVSDRAAVDAAMDQARAAFGPIGILVTSAGIEGFASFLDIDVATWERILAVNLTGTFHCIQSVVPDMVAAGWGRIVTISSSSAQSGTKRMAHYVASKGITVNTIPPGAIDTPMMRRPMESGAMASLDQVVARAPLGRLGTPDDIAAACAFLCSEEAGYITGQQINVNGAWYI
jgi:NAD(P)-dependent dehydrogenase (short-subunit alcohol dehydrogenase family)